MKYIHLVAVLALLQYMAFAALVGRARGKYGIRAPATTGHEMFDRAYRVQMNTLEQMVVFLPALWMAAAYWPPAVAAGMGVVYLAGRLVYWRRYMADPASRAPGAILTALANAVLLVLALVGIVMPTTG